MKIKKEIQCPICKIRGKDGTLELLDKKEVLRLEEFEGKDIYPKKIYGCDECRYWCDAKEINNL